MVSNSGSVLVMKLEMEIITRVGGGGGGGGEAGYHRGGISFGGLFP